MSIKRSVVSHTAFRLNDITVRTRLKRFVETRAAVDFVAVSHNIVPVKVITTTMTFAVILGKTLLTNKSIRIVTEFRLLHVGFLVKLGTTRATNIEFGDALLTDKRFVTHDLKL